MKVFYFVHASLCCVSQDLRVCTTTGTAAAITATGLLSQDGNMRAAGRGLRTTKNDARRMRGSSLFCLEVVSPSKTSAPNQPKVHPFGLPLEFGCQEV